jgi:hypothetical protein
MKPKILVSGKKKLKANLAIISDHWQYKKMVKFFQFCQIEKLCTHCRATLNK